MDAGTLNVKGTIDRRTPGTDALNMPLATWEVFIEDVWANVKGQTGLGAVREAQGKIPDGGSLYSIRIRFRPNAGITAGMRYSAGDQHFDIHKIRHDFERREWTDLICTHGASDG
jgi:head-tail adaptor